MWPKWRLWSELAAALQIVGATLVLIGAPVFLMLGPNGLDVGEEQFAAGSAFSGVVLGALLSVFVQGHFSTKLERARRLGLAHSIFFKVLRYASDAEQVCRHVERNRPQNGQVEWRSIPPLLMPNINAADFTPDELSLFAVGGAITICRSLVGFCVASQSSASHQRELSRTTRGAGARTPAKQGRRGVRRRAWSR